MKKIEEVFRALTELELAGRQGITAVELSSILKMDRANVSRYLNDLCEAKRLIKLNGRPVLYQSLKSEKKKLAGTSLDIMVGAKLSLQIPIQQAKAAVLYPPRGLNTLILGETGVGKSMFAELMYRFAIESNVIEPDAPFVRFNCADYADNPQLVLAQIFGVKKGAYSGADQDRDGLLKQADQGVFFLDEVHRLSPQGQEMLFTYLDNGFFRPLGETSKVIYAEVQIIAATTEDPQSVLLKAFCRRIPMLITLPPLRERSFTERYHLLQEFIKNESQRLNKDICINKQAVVSFLLYDCPNNVGQLKSDLQLACAKAFLKYKAQSRDYILIEQADLHNRVKTGLMKIQQHRPSIEQFMKNKGDVLVFNFHDTTRQGVELETEDWPDSAFLYDVIETKLEKLRSQGMGEREINELLTVDIETYLKKYLGDLPQKYKRDEVSKVVGVEIAQAVENILELAHKKLDIDYDERTYCALALHLHKSLERIQAGGTIYHPKLNIIRAKHAEEFLVAMEAAALLDRQFNIQIPLDEIGYLTMFLLALPAENSRQVIDKVGILVIMHGNAAANSICQVANSLIGLEYANALDMPLTMTAEEMYEIAKRKVIEIAKNRGVLLLVDMGSLTTFGDMITEETGIAVKTMDMVSTPLVIEACRQALAGKEMDAVYQACQETTRYKIQSLPQGKQKRKPLLVTSCFTGDGAAEQLKTIIGRHIPAEQADIIALSILDREDFLASIRELSSLYRIVAVIGSVNMNIENVPFFTAAEIITGEAIAKLTVLVKDEFTYSKVADSLRLHVKTIQTDTIVDDVRKIIRLMEQGVSLTIPEDVKIGLVLHICFMLDKLKSGGAEACFPNLVEYLAEYRNEFAVINQALKQLEQRYGIRIGKNEQAYILRMLINNGESV